VVLATGGHPLPLVMRASGEVEPAGSHGTLLGIVDTPDISEERVLLGPGDTLVLYTDGVVDARDASGGRFGETRLQASIDAAAGGSAEDVAAAVDEAVAAFEPDRTRDDRAILVLRVS
jgi:sigma-B regulation protein RsbU (phosphoserine phosphatase)